MTNCIINGKQCTIVWYVDDNKISHVDPSIVMQVIGKIEEHFGAMTVTRGSTHQFLGMTVEYCDGFAMITMREHIESAITESEVKVGGRAVTPAKRDLFEIRDNSPILPEKQADRFHRTVAKLLYVSKWSRPDILLPVSFLCTCVTCSTKHNWEKLE